MQRRPFPFCHVAETSIVSPSAKHVTLMALLRKSSLAVLSSVTWFALVVRKHSTPGEDHKK